MTHDSATRIVAQLVPEIEKRGSAAGVLTSYAVAEDLPPAQLEKLAQVYNTLRTVSHIDTADESGRGSTVPLLDVPKLVLDYASENEKSARTRLADASHDVRLVDLNRALRSELRPALSKAAAADMDTLRQQSDAALTVTINRATAEEALLSLEVDLEHDISKMASDLFGAAPRPDAINRPLVRDISEFELEALYHQPTSIVKAAGDYLAAFAAPHRVTLLRHDFSAPLSKRAYALGHERGEQLGALGLALGAYDVIKSASTSAEDVFALINAAGQSPDADMNIRYDPEAADPSAPASEGDAEDTAAILEQAKNDGLIASTEQQPHPPREQREARQEKSDKDSGGKGGKGRGVGDLALSAAAAPFAAVGHAVTGAAQKADEALSKIVSKERNNGAQRAADMSIDDIKRAMSLRRLIGTDPVLREQDPKTVLEIYNAVAARNPEVASDMASLRLVLREAVSYEGLTLDAQKQLTEVRKNSLQGQKESEDLDRRRYAAGASPLPISKA